MRDHVTVYFWIEPTPKACWACKHIIPVENEPRTIRRIMRFKRSDNTYFAKQQLKLWMNQYKEDAELFGRKYEFIEGKPPCKNTN